MRKVSTDCPRPVTSLPFVGKLDGTLWGRTWNKSKLNDFRGRAEVFCLGYNTGSAAVGYHLTVKRNRNFLQTRDRWVLRVQLNLFWGTYCQMSLFPFLLSASGLLIQGYSSIFANAPQHDSSPGLPRQLCWCPSSFPHCSSPGLYHFHSSSNASQSWPTSTSCNFCSRFPSISNPSLPDYSSPGLPYTALP